MPAKTIKLESQLPSAPAMSLAVTVGLLQYDPNAYVKGNDIKTFDEFEQRAWMDRLRLFQQMVLAGAEYDDCKIVYKDFKLKRTHFSVLKIIHKYSTAWVKGYIVDELLKHISAQEKLKGGGDPVAVATLIEKLLNGKEEESAGVSVSGHIRIDVDDEGL